MKVGNQFNTARLEMDAKADAKVSHLAGLFFANPDANVDVRQGRLDKDIKVLGCVLNLVARRLGMDARSNFCF